MLINVELPSGITIKVESEWYYSMTDEQLEKFYENNLINYTYHQTIQDPFDNSILNGSIQIESIEDIEDIEEIDTSIDYEYTEE
jgi:hypothetical protein